MLFGSTEIELLHPTGEPTDAAKHRYEATHQPKPTTEARLPRQHADITLLLAGVWAQFGRYRRIA
jgi:hypothetical protein